MPQDFRLQVFTWISSPRAPDYTIEDISNFLEIDEIFAAQGAQPVPLTPVANGKKSTFRKVFIISFGHLLVVELAYR